MFETLQVLPLIFWIVIGLLVAGFMSAARGVGRAYGIPMCAVLVTVAVWYVGDALYNDYTSLHMMLFSPAILTKSWGQVAIFLVVFIASAPALHASINRRYLGRPSQVLVMFRQGVNQAQFQRGLTVIFRFTFGLWMFILVFAAYNFGARFFDYLFPYLGTHPGPWVLNGKATGAMDTLLALAGLLQIMVGAIFGVVAALSTNRNIRLLAILGVFLTWPYFIFDRTRKSILAIVCPAVLAWVSLRFRTTILTKVLIASLGFLVVNAWFGFVISHRTNWAITDAFAKEGFNFAKSSKEKHQGLNMFEELCWVFQLTEDGSYKPNWGGNYLANLANPIPRMIWPNKPTIGLDYAIARGMGGADSGAGVYATLSTGLIGQGVANFGNYLGPAVAALLMGLWVCWLGRLDLIGQNIGALPLYGLGLIITFTLGRDITFLDLYPFVFGYGLCWWLNRKYGLGLKSKGGNRRSKRRSSTSQREREVAIVHGKTPSTGAAQTKG